MPFEQPHQDQNELKVPANQQEKGPETVDPAVTAKEHIAAAEELAAKESNAAKVASMRYTALTLDTKNPPKVNTTLGFNLLKGDTEKVLARRIAEAERLLKEHEADWHQSPASRGSMLSLKPTYKQPVELTAPLARLKEEYAKAQATKDENELQKIRVRIGLPALPSNLVAEGEDFQALAKEGLNNADISTQVNLEFLRKDFERVMADLDTAEIAIEVGGAVAISVVTGGSGPAAVLAAQLALTIATESEKVIVANKPVDAAVQDAVISAISNALGMKIGQSIGKQLQAGSKVAGIDRLLGKAGELIQQVVKNKAAIEAAKKTASSVAQNGLEGGIDAALTTGSRSIGDSIRKDGVDALTKVETYTTAAGKAGDAVVPGVLGGAVMGTTMEFSLNRLRGLYGKNAAIKNTPEMTKAELRDNIMRLPDADRPHAAEIILAHPLTSAQKQAVLAAHDVPMKDGQKYSQGELMQKMRILEASGISRTDADQLLRMGVCGAPPPPPVPKPKNTPATQPISGPTFLPKKPLPPPPSKMTRENLLGEYKRDIAVNQSAIATLDTELVRLNVEYKTLNEKLRNTNMPKSERDALYTRRNAISRRAEAIETQTAKYTENIQRYERESSGSPIPKETIPKKPVDTLDDDELIDFKIIKPKYEGASNNLEKARTYLQDFNPETTPTKPDEFLFSLTNGKRLDQAEMLPVNNQRVLVVDIPQNEFNGGQMILIPEKEGAQLVSFEYANCMIMSCTAIKDNQRYIGLAHISVGSWETNINKALDTIAGAGFTFDSFAISPRKDRLMGDVEKHLERLKTNPRPIMKEIRGTNEDLRTINGVKSTNETYASYSAAIVEHTKGKTRLTFDIGEKPDPTGVAPVIVTQKQIEFEQTK